MAVFSTNQNRQLYVVSEVQTTNVSKVGDIKLSSDFEGNIFFNYVGVKGKMRTDLIDPSTITNIVLSKPKKHQLKEVKVTLDDNVNGGNLIVGEDYIIRINFRQLYGMSDEDIYQKYGAVHVTKAMQTTPALFWAEMAYSLVKNFSKVYSPLLSIKIADKVVARATKVNGEIKLYEADGSEITTTTATDLTICEYPQNEEYVRGVKPIVPVYFEVYPTTVYIDGSDEIWGKTEESMVDSEITNGYDYADLEYFCMGERGDQYRYKHWPNVIHTQYLVDPSQEYYAIDIQYAYRGTCEDIQKSEKHLTLISTTDLTTLLASIKEKLPEAAQTKLMSMLSEGGKAVDTGLDK